MQALTDKLNSIYKSKRFNLTAFGLIAALILIAYSNTFTASFHFDDNPAIVENPYIKRVTMDNIMHHLQSFRPVVDLSIMFNYMVSGLNVVGWHIFNISVHILNSIMIYLLMLWTLNLPVLATKYGERSKRMALFGALLFAVHPIQTESVTYIISRSELLAAFFYLLAFLLFIKGARTNKFIYYVAVLFASLFSMASKQWAVTLPAMLFLYDYVFLSGGAIKTALSRWKAYILSAIPWIFIYKTISLFAPAGGSPGFGFNVSTTSGITPWTYLLTSMNVLWTYIRLLFLPINQNIDYDYPVAKTLFEFPTLLSFLGHIAVIAAAFWLYKKKRWILMPFGAAWFYITLSPVQSFVPIIDVIFEHRIYLPSVGFFIAFIAVYEEAFDWLAAKTEERKTLKARGA